MVSQPPAQAQPQSVQGVVTPQQSPQQQKLQSREVGLCVCVCVCVGVGVGVGVCTCACE